MSVSSYLQAFLTIYGWEMYYVLYLLFASIGLFLYPFLRILNDVYVGYVSGSEYAGTNYLRQLLAGIVMAGLVFWLALVPVVSLSLQNTTVISACAEKHDVEQINQQSSQTYFNNTSTRVPIMPYLAMAIGNGINAVIYSQTPCSLDISEVRKATVNVSLTAAKDSQALQNELRRFVGECHTPARNIIKEIQANKYGEEAATILNNKLDALMRSNEYKGEGYKTYLLNNYNSPLIRQLLYETNSPLSGVAATQTIVPLVSANSVPGLSGVEQGSSQQGTSTPTTCEQWWAGGGTGLQARVIKGLERSMAINAGNSLGVEACQNDEYLGWGGMSDGRKQECINKIKADLFTGNGDDLAEVLFLQMQGGATDNTIGKADGQKLAGLAGLGAAATAISMLPGVDFGSGVLGQAITFYTTIYILKILLQFLVPMILMAVFMFWAIYMTIGEFRGMAMIKGMILIIALTVMPGLWSIVDYLDDKLYYMMYGRSAAEVVAEITANGIVDIGTMIISPIQGIMNMVHSDAPAEAMNILLIDLTTGIFEIAIVFVLFYLIGEAGGGNAGGAVNDSQRFSNTAASGAGGAFGSQTGKAVKWTTVGKGNSGGYGKKGYQWAIHGSRNSKGEITSGGYGVKLSKGISGGVDRVRSMFKNRGGKE